MVDDARSIAPELKAEIKKLALTYGTNTVFTTFLELSAVSLGTQMDPINAEKHEQRYQEIVSNMDPAVVSSYARMLALLILAIRKHTDDPQDILGAVYQELGLNNEWKGQFFTPDPVSRMMALILNPVDESKDFITINEPTCGSGTMVIGVIWAMLQKKFDYQSKSLFIAQDIDIRCVWMTYIQLTLYKVPAVIIHGNTLTLEEWSRWYTPNAYLVTSVDALSDNNKKGVAQNECE